MYTLAIHLKKSNFLGGKQRFCESQLLSCSSRRTTWWGYAVLSMANTRHFLTQPLVQTFTLLGKITFSHFISSPFGRFDLTLKDSGAVQHLKHDSSVKVCQEPRPPSVSMDTIEYSALTNINVLPYSKICIVLFLGVCLIRVCSINFHSTSGNY